MKRWRMAMLGILVLGLAGSAQAKSLWGTDLEAAKAKAKGTNRYLLLDFSGSDWCGWCIKLEEEVFSKKAFTEYAEKNLVCVLLDFPRGGSQSRDEKEQNAACAKAFQIQGFPTVLILSPDAELVHRTGYRDGGAESYVKYLDQVIEAHRAEHKVPPPSTGPAAASPAAAGTGAAFGAGGVRMNIPPPSLTRHVPLPRDENREARTWTSASGATVTASLVEESGAFLMLKKEDGSRVKILKNQLSAADREYVEGLKK